MLGLSCVRLFATPQTVAYGLLCPWDSPGKNTGVGCHSLLQGIFPAQGWNSGLPHRGRILYRLSHQRSPGYIYSSPVLLLYCLDQGTVFLLFSSFYSFFKCWVKCHFSCDKVTNLPRKNQSLPSQFSLVGQSCPTLCDPMDCSTPGFPVHHQLLELAQIRVHWVGDTIQPSHPLSFPSLPTFNLSQHLGLFKMRQFFASGGQSLGVSASASVLPMNLSSGLISFRMDWLDLLLSSVIINMLWVNVLFILSVCSTRQCAPQKEKQIR